MSETRLQIVDGVVVNAVEVNPANVPGWAEGWPVAPAGVGIGWTVDGASYAAPVVVPVVPPSITFRQLLIGLVAEGWITEAEGEGWLVGTLPAVAETLIAGLPEAQRFAARASMVRPSVILRADSLVGALAAVEGKTDAEIDTFFITYGSV